MAAVTPEAFWAASSWATVPVSPTTSTGSADNHSFRRWGVSRLGSVVTNTTLAPTRLRSLRAAVSTFMLIGQTSGQFVYPKKRKVSFPAVSAWKS